ncbi:MAG: hypothetical protein K6D02_07585, partial [Lachnospiraceae bacterium]|nr:hypothetical protein [Lachnospiraceae bacterium]
EWTWFGDDGKALSDSEVKNMSTEDKAEAFIEGRYVKASSGEGSGGPGGGMGGAPGGSSDGEMPEGGPSGMGDGEKPDGAPSDMGNGGPGGDSGDSSDSSSDAKAEGSSDTSSDSKPEGNSDAKAEGSSEGNSDGNSTEKVGTPDQGTTQASGNSTDSSNYESFEDMLDAYKEDIESVEKGDDYENNIVELYNPVNYVGAEDTENPTWTRILMGASEGDISMLNSLNLEIAWLMAGTEAEIEWQWDGGHVPSEILGDSLALYVDKMYGKYVDGAKKVEKAAAEKQTKNGSESEATGTDRSKWVKYKNGKVDFSLADAAAYRTAGASKAIPGFDVMDYGQEDYVFGNSSKDARHWDKYVLKVFEEHEDDLKDLFNANSSDDSSDD